MWPTRIKIVFDIFQKEIGDYWSTSHHLEGGLQRFRERFTH